LKTRTLCLSALLASIPLAGVAPLAVADTAEELNAMSHVRLTTEPALAAGCTRVGAMSDDNIKDLRRKIVRAGGNTAVISFNTTEMSMLLAEVFRCSATPNGPSIPHPPAGAPPAPPPAR
jgi:hypothetical protein